MFDTMRRCSVGIALALVLGRRRAQPSRRRRRRRDAPQAQRPDDKPHARDLRLRPGRRDRRLQAEQPRLVRRQPAVAAAERSTDEFGEDGHFYLSARQSRFGVKGDAADRATAT